MVNLEFTYGGISFLVRADVDNDYVVGVTDICVYSADKKYLPIEVNDSEEFFRTFEDDLQQAYQDYLEDLAITAAEMRMEAQKEEAALENWEKNN